MSRWGKQGNALCQGGVSKGMFCVRSIIHCLMAANYYGDRITAIKLKLN